jgi:hypothetical protein
MKRYVVFQVIFQVLPEALDRIELRAIGREKDQPDVLRNRPQYMTKVEQV